MLPLRRARCARCDCPSLVTSWPCLGVIVTMLGLAGATAYANAAEATRYRVYIGTYTGENSRGIYATELDVAAATLSKPTCVAELKNPSFLALHPSQPVLYAVGELGEFQGKRSGAVSALRIDDQTGELTLLGQQPSGAGGACHLSVDARGRVVVVANYGGGSVASFPLTEDGRLQPAASVIQHTGQSVHPTRQTAPHAHAAVWDPTGRFVLVPDLGLDKVMLYRADLSTAELQPHEPPHIDVPPGSGPRHCEFGADGRTLYVLNELTTTVSVFRYVTQQATFEAIQSISALPEDFDGSNTSAEVVVHPSGRYLYTSNRGHDSIAVFAIDGDSGRLTLIDHVPSGGRTPRSFAVDPTGSILLSANQDSDNVVVYRIDPESGVPEPAGNEISVGKPVCLVFRALP